MHQDTAAPAGQRAATITRWLAALLSGLITGVITIITSVSLAALIFAGELADHLAHGISMALISAVLVGLVFSVAGSCAVAGPQDRTAPLIAIMAAAIVAGAPAGATSEQIFLSVVTGIVAATLITGTVLLALGLGRAGGLMRFIPYSVLGGFFAGTGWLLLLGGLRVMTGLELNSPGAMIELTEAALLAHWLPGLGIALAMFVAARFVSYAIALPLLLLAATGLFFAVMLGDGQTLASLTDAGWLLGAVEQHDANRSVPSLLQLLRQGDWSIVPGQWGSIASIFVMTAVSILLSVSALEMVSGQDADVNRELRIAGLANLAAGMGTGMIGFHSLSISSLALKLGVKMRIAGIIAALTCAAGLLFGAELIAHLPRIVLGGLLVFLGLSFLAQWLIGAWGKLPHGEYLVVPLILVIIASVGFIEGLLAGLLAALVLFVLNYSRTPMIRYALSGRQMNSTVERNLDDEHFLREHGEQLCAMKLRGYLFFGTATQLWSRVRHRAVESAKDPLRFVLLDFGQVNGIDSSATYAFHRMRLLARQQGFVLLLTGLAPSLQRQLQLAGLTEDDGLVRTFVDMDHGLEWYENQVLQGAGQGRTRVSQTILQRLSGQFDDAATVAEFLGYLEQLTFTEGYQLIGQGDPGGDLYFLEQGEVSVQLSRPQGDTVRIRRTGAGTVIGELGFYLGTPRSATVIAERPGKAYRLSAAGLAKMEKERPEFAAVLHRFIADLLAERLLNATRTLDVLLD